MKPRAEAYKASKAIALRMVRDNVLDEQAFRIAGRYLGESRLQDQPDIVEHWQKKYRQIFSPQTPRKRARCDRRARQAAWRQACRDMEQHLRNNVARLQRFNARKAENDAADRQRAAAGTETGPGVRVEMPDRIVIVGVSPKGVPVDRANENAASGANAGGAEREGAVANYGGQRGG